jgi:hypothetical protein
MRANSRGIALLAEGTLGIAARVLVEKEERALRRRRARMADCASPISRTSAATSPGLEAARVDPAGP